MECVLVDESYSYFLIEFVKKSISYSRILEGSKCCSLSVERKQHRLPCVSKELEYYLPCMVFLNIPTAQSQEKEIMKHLTLKGVFWGK